MSDTTFVDFEITKADTQADGTVIVRGPATTDDIDSDRQIIDSEFAQRKLPDWLKSGGNVRRMHQPDAIGGGISLEREGNAQILTAHIIDPTACKLAAPHPVTGVRVLRAFSVGISGARIVKDAKAPGGRIVDGEFVEVSLVDRPANASCKVDLVSKAANGDAQFSDVLVKADMEKDCPTCHGDGKIRDGNMDCPDCHGTGKMSMEEAEDTKALFAVEGALYKKDYSTAERKEMADKGHSLPDGSYPIADTEDLHNAYTLAASGHGDVPAAKKLIARRAKELGVANPFEKDDAEKVEKKKGKIPPDDQKVTEALQEATEAQDEDNADHMSGDDEDDMDAEKVDAPYVLKRLHDHLCPAFTPEAVKSAYPTVRAFGDVVDAHYWAERITEIIGLDAGTGRYAGDIAKFSTAYGLSVQLSKLDEETALDARETLAKAFSDMYPSVHLTPGDIMPSQFRRPPLTAGRANATASAGQHPRLPMSASTPDAANFDRGYIADGRAANSPSAGPPNTASSSKLKKSECSGEVHEVEGVSIYKAIHTPSGLTAQGLSEEDAWEGLQALYKQRSFYTNNARDQAAEVMTGMHDYIVAMHPGICPMASKEDSTMDDADADDSGTTQVDNRADSSPMAHAGYEKVADIQKVVRDEIAKAIGPLEKKNKKLKRRAEEAEARVAELAKMADPAETPYRGGRGVIPFVPKREETSQGSEDQAEVEKREKVAWLLEKVQTSGDQASKRQAMDMLEGMLSPDELAAALVKTG